MVFEGAWGFARASETVQVFTPLLLQNTEHLCTEYSFETALKRLLTHPRWGVGGGPRLQMSALDPAPFVERWLYIPALVGGKTRCQNKQLRLAGVCETNLPAATPDGSIDQSQPQLLYQTCQLEKLCVMKLRLQRWRRSCLGLLPRTLFGLGSEIHFLWTQNSPQKQKFSLSSFNTVLTRTSSTFPLCNIK